MQEAQGFLLKVAVDHQRPVEIEIMGNANRRIEYQRNNFTQLAMSEQMIQKRVEGLELAAAQEYSIDTENGVVINPAPALPLAIETFAHYSGQVVVCLINATYKPWFNVVGRQFIEEQEQLAELQRHMAEAQERPTPLEEAFSEDVHSGGTTHSVRKLRPSSRLLRVTKCGSILLWRSSRQNSGQLPPREAVSRTPSLLPRSSTLPAVPAGEQSTQAICIER